MPRIAPRAFRALLSVPVQTPRTISHLPSLLPARTQHFHPLFTSLTSRPSIFSPPLQLSIRHKGNTYGDEYQPSTRKRKRKFGFLHRLKKHPKLLARRRAKGPLLMPFPSPKLRSFALVDRPEIPHFLISSPKYRNGFPPRSIGLAMSHISCCLQTRQSDGPGLSPQRQS